MADAFQVSDAVTTSEEAELSQEFLRKKNLYLRKTYNAGPEAARKDKTYRRLVQMFAV
jgi:hypothetical protein